MAESMLQKLLVPKFLGAISILYDCGQVCSFLVCKSAIWRWGVGSMEGMLMVDKWSDYSSCSMDRELLRRDEAHFR